MERKLFIIGNEDSVIYYNLNNQFTNINKIIITKEILLNSFESKDIYNLFEVLKTTKPDNYLNLIEQSKTDGVFQIPIKNDLYSKIHEYLPKISESLMDVKLENFNFMNSVSSSNLTISLRTANYSITKYIQEKGNIIHDIRELIEEYLFNESNKFLLPKIDEFQIEIYEFEEIYKQVFLKKDSNILQLYSGVGFSYSKPLDYFIGGEFYYSIGDDFSFYENKQTHALIRERTKLVEKEINKQKNILSNNELIILNDITKNIDDALIEIYFNSKGNVRINNISLLNNQLSLKSDNGFVINKSTNNYDKITTITVRDDITEDTPNPKYLVIRNLNEVKEFMSNINQIEKLDGIIFTHNFYSPILDKLSNKLNVDILYINKNIPKCLECTINWEDLDIIFEDEMNSKKTNPFNNIINLNDKNKSKQLERLKNIDLSTPNPAPRGNQNNNVENITNSILSSANSSINKTNVHEKENTQNNNKKSAIDFLVQTALNGPVRDKQLDLNESINDEEPNLEDKTEKKNINNDDKSYNDVDTNLNKSNNFFDDNNLNLYSENEPIVGIEEEVKEDIIIEEKKNYNENIFNEGNNLNQSENIQSQNYELKKYNKNDIYKYDSILSCNILTSSNITNSDNYLVDSSSVSSIVNLGLNNKVFYLTNQVDSLNNPNFNYILPVELYNDNINYNKDNYLIINFPAEYFLIENHLFDKYKFFLNLTRMEKRIRNNILDFAIRDMKRISLIILKEDLDLIENYINKIDNLMIEGINSNDEYEFCKNKILSFEKKFIMDNI